MGARNADFPWLSDGVKRDIEQLVGNLKETQQKCSQARFHLFMETDLDDQGDAKHGETRVLFSPTISFRGNSLETQSRTEELVYALRTLSVMAMAVTRYCSTQNPQRHRVTAPSASRGVVLPQWFPGRSYTGENVNDDNTWRKMREERLQINAEYAARFSNMCQPDLRELYQSFFTQLHRDIRNIDKSLVRNKLEYARFTPPWFRQQLSVRDRPICYLTKIGSSELVLPDLRAQRSIIGHQRMAWLLAAFYEFEPQLSKELLEKLVEEIPQRNSSSMNVRSKRRQIEQAPSHRKKKVGRIVGHVSTHQPKSTSNPDSSSPCNRSSDEASRLPANEPSTPVIFNGHEIFCAFGVSCRFRNIEQDPARITAKCRKCNVSKMHDLCGGGEDGERICPRCNLQSS